MENASKALIIAASVLIVILLIAFGMKIFNSTQGTGDSLEDTMNATEIATFNNKFTAYAGSVKSAAQAKALANVVIASNTKLEDTKKISVQVNAKSAVKDAGSITTNVADLAGNVKIEMKDNNSDGLIDYITITNNP